MKIFQPTTGGGGGGGVTSLNSLTGALTLAEGSNITITPSGGNTLTIASTGGGAPASPDTSVQFNNSGAFGGNANFTFDPATGAFNVQQTLTGITSGFNTSSMVSGIAKGSAIFSGDGTSVSIVGVLDFGNPVWDAGIFHGNAVNDVATATFTEDGSGNNVFNIVVPNGLHNGDFTMSNTGANFGFQNDGGVFRRFQTTDSSIGWGVAGVSFTLPEAHGSTGQALVDNGSGNLSFAGPFPSGSGTIGQVAYWDSSNSITSDGNFLWDPTNKVFIVGDTTVHKTDFELNGIGETINLSTNGDINFRTGDHLTTYLQTNGSMMQFVAGDVGETNNKSKIGVNASTNAIFLQSLTGTTNIGDIPQTGNLGLLTLDLTTSDAALNYTIDGKKKFSVNGLGQGLYGLGDIENVDDGIFMFINSNLHVFGVKYGGTGDPFTAPAMFEVQPQGGYTGDISQAFNGTYDLWQDSTQSFQFFTKIDGTNTGRMLDLEGLAGTASIGDCDDIIQGTRIEVDFLTKQTISIYGGLVMASVGILAYGDTINFDPDGLGAITEVAVSGGAGGPTFIILPTGTIAPIGSVLVISDLGVDSAANNITIDAGTGNTITSTTGVAQTFVINANGESITIKKLTATAWMVE